MSCSTIAQVKGIKHMGRAENRTLKRSVDLLQAFLRPDVESMRRKRKDAASSILWIVGCKLHTSEESGEADGLRDFDTDVLYVQLDFEERPRRRVLPQPTARADSCSRTRPSSTRGRATVEGC